MHGAYQQTYKAITYTYRDSGKDSGETVAQSAPSAASRSASLLDVRRACTYLRRVEKKQPESGAPTAQADNDAKAALSPKLLGLFVVVPLLVLALGGLAMSWISRGAAAPPAGGATVGASSSPTAEPGPCKREGERCLFAPGKFGTCVSKIDCDETTRSCFTCQSQH